MMYQLFYVMMYQLFGVVHIGIVDTLSVEGTVDRFESPAV
jgi:hypothetical protein